MVGLANGGKTTLVNQLKPTKTRDLEVAPTVGFSVERFTPHKCSLTVVDPGGQSKYHDLWECYYKDAQAVVSVVDAASDEAALDESRETLHEMLAHEHLAGRSLSLSLSLSLLPNARSAADVAAEVHLTGARVRGEAVRSLRRVRRRHGRRRGRGNQMAPGKAIGARARTTRSARPGSRSERDHPIDASANASLERMRQTL